MLQITDDNRLVEVLETIKSLNIRFPVAEIEKKTGFNKGNISSILSGKKPMSDNFYKTFMKEFSSKPIENNNNPVYKKIPDIYREFGTIEERLIKSESKNAVLTEVVKELIKAVDALNNKIFNTSFPITPSKVDEITSKASKRSLDELRRKNK